MPIIVLSNNQRVKILFFKKNKCIVKRMTFILSEEISILSINHTSHNFYWQEILNIPCFILFLKMGTYQCL